MALIYVLIFVQLFIMIGVVQSEDNIFKVGQPFPDIVLPALKNGQPGSVTDFRGQKLILHIFASW